MRIRVRFRMRFRVRFRVRIRVRIIVNMNEEKSDFSLLFEISLLFI
jgi:hypothetical protein